MSSFKMVISILVGLFVVMSLLPYGEKTNPKTNPDLALKAPQKVMRILKKSCYDCHSNQTKWPWYSSIFPLSWSIKDHVKNGRLALNFDIWNSYSKEKQQQKKQKIYTKTGTTMPVASYLWFHKDAKLSKDEIKIIKDWASKEEEIVESKITQKHF